MAQPGIRLHIEVTHDLGAFADRTGAKIRRGAMRGAKRFEARAKLEYRQDVRRVGLGDRLANTWRTRVYPLRGESWHPTVHLWSSAPMLAKAHADGGVIVPKAGKFLAIPTENVAHKGGRRRTPLDIESEFNQDLVINPSRRDAGCAIEPTLFAAGRHLKDMHRRALPLLLRQSTQPSTTRSYFGLLAPSSSASGTSCRLSS